MHLQARAEFSMEDEVRKSTDSANAFDILEATQDKERAPDLVL
jgi:hypothetical protein